MGKPKKLIFLRAPSSRLRRVTVGPILGGSPEPGKLKHEGQKKQKMLARVTHINSEQKKPSNETPPRHT